MRIAIDLRWVRSEQIDGISRYALNLVRHLLAMDSKNEYLLLGNDAILRRHIDLSPFENCSMPPFHLPLLSPQDFLRTPRALERLGIDIFHVPNYLTSPFQGRYKKILTVFDLIPFLFPDALSKSRLLWRWFYKTLYPARIILKSADTIITTSENTKHDLVWLLRISPDIIQVVRAGVEKRFHPHYEVTDQFRRTYRLPPRFLLYVGRQDPYKGLTYLVQAYAHLPEALRREYQVVIVGKTDPRYIGEVHDWINKTGLYSSFYFLDYLPDHDLPLLYAAAALLVHPSLYEGFGLPPLEAMACGTPVVYADTSSLTEHLGTAALAVTPASAESLAGGIQQMLQDMALRESYIQKGKVHVQRYSWETVALTILHLYEQFVQDN
ncbi:glycosyl transferase group 1 [Candidatus Vecturithrix granuli]|uniref:Glycosyl transferase group 1 n=1 Tax=Vecturithrix granuli TaxID=1499967 RepID=A0A081BVI1_VECG1|nr:glycosyl transferase group 1 [Candidatus Vecturithrix granuli]